MTATPILLGRPMNFAVVQLPERKFPGVVVQGDTLYSIVSNLTNLKRLLEIGDLDELRSGIEMIDEQLSTALDSYERVCAKQGIELPYHRK